jgi:hypothetical protein
MPKDAKSSTAPDNTRSLLIMRLPPAPVLRWESAAMACDFCLLSRCDPPAISHRRRRSLSPNSRPNNKSSLIHKRHWDDSGARATEVPVRSAATGSSVEQAVATRCLCFDSLFVTHFQPSRICATREASKVSQEDFCRVKRGHHHFDSLTNVSHRTVKLAVYRDDSDEA